MALSRDCCRSLFKLKMALKDSRASGWKMDSCAALIAKSKFQVSSTHIQSHSCVHAVQYPCHLSQVTQQKSSCKRERYKVLGASSAYPDTVVVKVPPRCEESTKLVLVCDSLSTVSRGRELLVPAPVVPPFVFDFTFVCLVVLQNCTFSQCSTKSTKVNPVE